MRFRRVAYRHRGMERRRCINMEDWRYAVVETCCRRVCVEARRYGLLKSRCKCTDVKAGSSGAEVRCCCAVMVAWTYGGEPEACRHGRM